MAARRLRVADDLLGPAVAETVGALTLAPEDAGAVKLAERYAAAIDEAVRIAAALESVLGEGDEDTAKLVQVLAAKVRTQTVLETLGPKLLAALESLGATPAARAKLKAGGGPGGPSRLQALRATRSG